jgi:hypothetical protein
VERLAATPPGPAVGTALRTTPGSRNARGRGGEPTLADWSFENEHLFWEETQRAPSGNAASSHAQPSTPAPSVYAPPRTAFGQMALICLVPGPTLPRCSPIGPRRDAKRQGHGERLLRRYRPCLCLVVFPRDKARRRAHRKVGLGRAARGPPSDASSTAAPPPWWAEKSSGLTPGCARVPRAALRERRRTTPFVFCSAPPAHGPGWDSRPFVEGAP